MSKVNFNPMWVDHECRSVGELVVGGRDERLLEARVGDRISKVYPVVVPLFPAPIPAGFVSPESRTRLIYLTTPPPFPAGGETSYLYVEEKLITGSPKNDVA